MLVWGVACQLIVFGASGVDLQGLLLRFAVEGKVAAYLGNVYPEHGKGADPGLGGRFTYTGLPVHCSKSRTQRIDSDRPDHQSNHTGFSENYSCGTEAESVHGRVIRPRGTGNR